ncbi:Rho-GTPase-activating protein 8 [Umbelopsis sp. WA50703]
MLYQETLRPDADVQYIVEQYRTARFCPRPILYLDYHNRPINDRNFGLPLDIVTEHSDLRIPKIMQEGIQQLDTISSRLFDEEISVIWTSDVPLDRVHEARAELNGHDSNIDQDKLKKYDPLLLASLLRLYLQELPECLLTFDLYDPVKVLYANSSLDTDTRIKSISNLLSTLPASNYQTTELLFRHLHRLTAGCQPPVNEVLSSKLSIVLGPILLRPRVDNTLTVHDKCPHRLVKDLIDHCDNIFSETAHESHQNNIQRTALVAPHDYTNTPVPTRRNTILSYFKSSSKPVTDEPATIIPPTATPTMTSHKPRPPIAPPRSSTLFEMDGRGSPSKEVFRRSSDTSLISKRPSMSTSVSTSQSSGSVDMDPAPTMLSPIIIDNIDAFFDDE